MAVTFLDLPDEVLHQIFIILVVRDVYGHGRVPSNGNSRPSMCALALVNRRISRVAQGIILRNLDFRPRPAGTHLKRTHWEVMEYFNRAWQENNSVLDQLDFVEIVTGPMGQNEHGKLSTLLNGLAKSQTMYRLGMYFTSLRCFGDVCAPLVRRCEDGYSHCFRKLHTLTISDTKNGCESQISTDEVFAISLLPVLTSLSVEIAIGPCLQALENFDSITPATLANPVSLREFFAFEKGPIHEDFLRLLLPRWHRLERLHIPLTWSTADLPHPDSSYEIWQDVHNLTSRLTRLSDLLVPCANDLTQLGIYDWRSLWWNSNIGNHLINQVLREQPINLYQLHKLEYLFISINLLSGRSVSSLPCNPGHEFVRLLPRSLRGIRLNYRGIQGIMYQSHHVESLSRWLSLDKAYNERNFRGEAHNFFDNLWLKELSQAEVVLTRLDWLVKCTELARELCPNLEYVLLAEELWDGLQCKKFRPRHAIRNINESSAMTVRLEFRVPDNWGPPDIVIGATRKHSLSNLPEAVLQSIFELLDLEDIANCAETNITRPSLFALSLTNQRLAASANFLLYKNIKFRIDDRDAATELSGVRILDRFLKGVRKYPHLLNRLDKFHAEAPGDNLWLFIPELAESKTLRDLTISAPLHEFFADALTEIFHKPRQYFTALESFTIYGHTSVLHAENLLHLCSLPNLKSFVTDMILHEPSKNVSPGISLAETIDIDELYLTGLAIHEGVLRFLLPRTRKLRTLSIHMPFSKTTNTDGTPQWTDDESVTKMSTSAELTQLLAPVSKSLENLFIRDWRTEHGFDKQITSTRLAKQDQEPVDLSTFEKLETVRIVVHLLSGPSRIDSPCNPAVGVHKLLPPSLRHLSVHYGSFQGIFYESQHVERFKELCMLDDDELEINAKIAFAEYANDVPYDRDRVYEKLRWFFDLVSQKEALPNLRSINLVEIFWSRLRMYDVWTTKIFPELFESVQQEVIIVSRMPMSVELKGELSILRGSL